MKELKDYIVVFDNALTGALCDSILNEYENCDDWIDAQTGNGIDPNVRNCRVIGISNSNIIDKNKNTRANLDKYLHACTTAVLRRYIQMFPKCRAVQDSGYDLLKYQEGCFYSEHTDYFTGLHRSISCSFSLNDGYVGGEFAFFNRELTYKVKKGSCIMFPSNFMYPHEIMPVTSGTRYSIVTWFI